jgi:eukaryotic-like serine/threonine-protein kinase
MGLTSGFRLGPYEIVSPLGAGGMGEVYKARDTRLDRTVAIKVLPTHVASNPDVHQRFEREAHAVAALNHPHICTLHDIGSQEGIDFLVMEYLDGETLADRLAKAQGGLPPEQALAVAVQIADALDKAHRAGIVHRDLKPGNIMLTKGGAKLLDFGLAKTGASVIGAGQSTLPTTPPNLTAQGTILGTFQYMAPEQLEGREADARTDVFAFGVVLYEMLTGKKAFEATSHASLIAAILDREPPAITTLQPLTPRSLERVVRKCLAKNPDNRWQSAGDLCDELKWIAGGTSAETTPLAGRPRNRTRVYAWATAASLLLTAALVTLAFAFGRPPPTVPEEIRFEVVTPNITNPRQITISPDGRWITFSASVANTTALFVRRIESTRPEQLAGTEGAFRPFWSPDSRYIGFFADGRIKKISVTGGPAQNICDATNIAGATWNAEGVIVFSAGGVLNRVSAAGGEPVPISVRDESRQESSHQWPFFLPDGRRYVYLAWSFQQSNSAAYVGSLDSQERTKLIDLQSKLVYALGYLLFHRNGTLYAQRFDASQTELTGEPVRIADEISYDVLGGEGAFSASQNGRLIYYAGGGPAVSRQFVWFDRTGKQLGNAGDPGLYTTNFDLSPDGTRIAVARGNPGNSQFDIWLLDWARNVPTRFTFDPALSPNGNVVWAPDGRVAFTSERQGNRDIFVRDATKFGAEAPLLATPTDEWPEDWSKDGRYLAFGFNVTRGGTTSTGDLAVLPLFGDGKPIPISPSPFLEDEPRFSFDGKWLAYNSDESGRPQVYLVSFPATDQKRQISTDGGVQPRWRRDGRELYYLALDGRLMAVELSLDSEIDSSVPRPLFNTRFSVDAQRDQFAVSPDGQRFLVQLPVVEGTPTPITVVLNWARPTVR